MPSHSLLPSESSRICADWGPCRPIAARAGAPNSPASRDGQPRRGVGRLPALLVLLASGAASAPRWPVSAGWLLILALFSVSAAAADPADNVRTRAAAEDATSSASAPLEYDLAVVGGGSGGFGAALAAARLGLNVVLVERADRLGGNSVVSGVTCWEPGGRDGDSVRRLPAAEADPEGCRHLLVRTAPCLVQPRPGTVSLPRRRNGHRSDSPLRRLPSPARFEGPWRRRSRLPRAVARRRV